MLTAQSIANNHLCGQMIVNLYTVNFQIFYTVTDVTTLNVTTCRLCIWAYISMLTVVFVLKCHFAISSPISKPGHLRWTITTMSHLVDWLHSSRLNNKFLSYVHLHLLHQTQGQKKSHFVAVCCYVESNSCSSFFSILSLAQVFLCISVTGSGTARREYGSCSPKTWPHAMWCYPAAAW